jgi:hypothetical protein
MEAGRRHTAPTGGRSSSAGAGAAAAGPLFPLALASLLAAAVAAGVQLIDPFGHGVWLVAYLLLVGSLAPFLLGLGETAVLRHAPPAHRANAQTALWGVGTIAVPLGVLGESRLAVVAGSAALMLSLGSMARALAEDADRVRPGALGGYAALLLFMVGSVCVGLALAWDLPWI